LRIFWDLLPDESWWRGFRPLADAPAIGHAADSRIDSSPLPHPARADSSLSLKSAWHVLSRRRRLVISVVAGSLLACLLYCLLVAPQYEAKARLALRTAAATPLHMDDADGAFSGSLASGQTQLETLAGVFRSDELAWRVIVDRNLYRSPPFFGAFARRFPHFRPDSPSPDAEAYLLGRFQDRLHVRTIPRTLLLEIDFRSGDAALSADVVNALIRAYEAQQTDARMQATGLASGWLNDQLRELKLTADRDNERLASFQRQHGILIAPETLSNGQAGAVQHVSALLEVDELGRALAAASADRILHEAEFRAASQGDPELVLASDAHFQGESGDFSIAAFRQIHTRRSELEEEEAQLSLERGPNFPRVLEIREQLQDLDRQLQSADEKLRERYRKAWQTAADREQMLRKALDDRTAEGMQANAAAIQYESMRREADASRELYLRVQSKAEEAGLAAGVPSPDFRVVDAARVPAKPSSPNLPLYMAIVLFLSSWLALGIAFAMESLRPTAARAILVLLVIALGAPCWQAQAPTPSTSGLPTGVARIPQSRDAKSAPNPKDAPAVWNGSGAATAGALASPPSLSGAIPAPIAPGDLLDVSEFHTPEFHSTVRVTAAGKISLPMVGEIAVTGMDEPQAVQAIAAALVERGMLKHPQVAVLVISSVGQDVSVLGEVVRPGVYPYGVHHRLLDLIAAAAGTGPTAGTLAYVYHRNDTAAAEVVLLDRSGAKVDTQHNPELEPGDTVQMSRTGLVYVVGDVMRPGGFALEPGQPMTVLQAVSLAWGPNQNAALSKTLLIREQQGGGRTVTTLNLKRMLRGQDPDMPIGERDILFVPDSMAKNLWNRTMESVVQSTAGVSIYAGLVYSQRF
jgi:polysaccharide export outer membrane protein